MTRFFFKNIDIRKAPGFKRGINVPGLDSLSPSINILTGPNGAGKSTTAGIIQKLIWHDDTRGYDVSGTFSMDDNNWLSEIDSSFSRFQKDGLEAVPANLPPSGAQRVYYLALHDLVKAEDADLAKNILDESIGGYDLGKVQADLYSSKTRITTRASEYASFKESVRKLKEVTELHRKLKNDENTLARLQEERDQAEKATEMKELFRLASDYLSAKMNLEKAGRKMSGYPGSLRLVTGDEIKVIGDCGSEIEEEIKIISAAQDVIRREELKLKGLKVPDQGIDDLILGELKGRTERLAEFEREIRQVKEPAIALQEAVRSEAGKNICNITDTERWKGIDLKQAGEIDNFFSNALSILKQKRLNETEIAALGKNGAILTSQAKIKNLGDGITILGNWMKEQGEGKRTGMPAWPVLTTALLSSVMIILILLTGSTTLLSTSVIIPFLAVIAIIAVTGLMLNTKGTIDNVLKIRESDFNKTGLKGPEKWDPSKVSERLAELLQELSEAKQKEAEELSVETKLKDLNERREALDKEIEKMDLLKNKLLEDMKAIPDFPADLSMSELYIFLSDVQKWQSAVIRLKGLLSEKESLEKSMNEEIGKCNLIFEKLNVGTALDPIGAKVIFEQLADNERKRRELVKNIELFKKSISESTGRKIIIENKINSVYRKLGIDFGNKDEVVQLLSLLDDYRKDNQEHSNATALYDEKKLNLERHPLYNRNAYEITVMDLVECRRREQNYEREAVRLNELLCDITRIETQVMQKKSGSELEDVLNMKNNAMLNLEKLHDQHLSSVAGSLLIENLQRETEEISRPEVFRNADSIFRKITNGKYELRVTQGNKFMAFDTQQNEALDLTQISTGTRVQLLLAIRLAFIEQQERGVKLPVIADELLANSDDHRAEAIISALFEITREGRQLFYLTAQTDEAMKWEEFLKKNNENEYRIILMDEAYKGHDRLKHKPGLENIVLAREIPRPDGMNVSEYRKKAGLPSYDLVCDYSGMLSIGFLTEDTGLLYRCLKFGVESWGQMNTFDYCGLIEGLDEDTLGRMKNKVRLLEDFQALYRQGRARRVDMDVLLGSMAITNSFREQVKEKLDQASGDPVRLLKDLPLGFRNKNKEILETFLLENGYMNEGKILLLSEIKPRLLITAAQLGIQAKEAEDFINAIIEN